LLFSFYIHRSCRIIAPANVCGSSAQIYPITGDRYRCCDCKEFIGFDLCGDCYNTRSKLPGRFNQQHKPEHQFKLIPCYGTILGGIDGYDNLVIIGADNLLPLVDDEEDNQNGEDNQNDSEATN
jgi:hypothetical protein